ncbi:MAG: flippase [Candidatus Staskawiczbacteria bacterium]|jgi:O-antigen/teichoic acid export membrane protein
MASFTKNVSVTFFIRVATALITVIITVIMARVLGPTGQGIYSVAVLFPSLLLIFTGFSLNSTVTYFLGKGEYPQKQVIGTSVILNLLVSFFTILIGFAVIFFFGGFFFPDIENVYLFLSLLLVPLNLFFSLGCQIFLGLQKFNKYNFISFFQSAIFLIFVTILLLTMHFGVTVTILSQIISYFIAIIILLFLIIKEIKGIDFKLSKVYLKEYFLYSVKSHLGNIFDFLHSRIDLFLINLFINPFSAGVYFASVRLVEGVWLFSGSIGTVLFPRLVSEKDPQKLKEFTPLICRNVLFFSTIIIIFLFIVSGWLITFLYSDNFSGAIMPFRILLVGILSISGFGILASDLAARGKPMINTYAIGVSAILNIILNLFWIPKWGINGAALATTVSYTVMFLVTIAIYIKVSGNKTRDIILIKKEDLITYKNLFLFIKEKLIK